MIPVFTTCTVTIPHPLSQCRGLLGKHSEDRLGQSKHIETVTHCFYEYCSLITTSCKLSSSFLTFLDKGQGCRLPTTRTANDEQALQLQRPKAVADVALVALEGTHQLLRTARYQSTGPLVIHGQPTQDTFLES